MKRQTNLEKAKQIEKQVERWDWFAKLAPTIFLFVCFVLLATGNTSFATVFFVGMVGFSITAVVWWWWTIFSIRYLVGLFYTANINLRDVGKELKDLRKEFDDEKNNRT